MNKEELKKWNKTLLRNIIEMETVIEVAEQKIKEHKAMYETMNGITIDGNPLPKSKVKFNGLRKHCKFDTVDDIIGL